MSVATAFTIYKGVQSYNNQEEEDDIFEKDIQSNVNEQQSVSSKENLKSDFNINKKMKKNNKRKEIEIIKINNYNNNNIIIKRETVDIMN